jgi:hypothetical protein
MTEHGPDTAPSTIKPPRFAGVVPSSPKGRLLLLFALVNLLLIFLAVWDLTGNSGQMIAGFLPLTILWVFAACALNNVLAVVVYVLLFRPWAERVHPSRTVDSSGGARP